jgi:hypothetical protein
MIVIIYFYKELCSLQLRIKVDYSSKDNSSVSVGNSKHPSKFEQPIISTVKI